MTTTLFVCIACRPRETGDGEARAPDDLPGLALAEALEARLGGNPALRIERVECLAVCKRPATVALAATGKWTYIVGDLSADGQLAQHVEDVAAAAAAYGATGNGIIPWRERPQSFRKGVVARLPPLPAAPNRTDEEGIAC